MNRDRLLRIMSLVLLMSTVLTSCQYTGQKSEGSQSTVGLSTTECLFGITPGQTSIEEAEDLLTARQFDARHCPVGVCVTWCGASSRPGSPFARACNSVHADKVSGPVVLVSAGLDFEFSLEKVLEEFGTPEKYLAFETDFTLLEGGHTPSVLLILYYIGQGRIIEAWIPGRGEEALITPQTSVDWIYCFLPTTVEHLTQDVSQLKRALRWEDSLKDWEGIEAIYVWPFGTVN
jgi:hypothetical protein